jgi:uncharacterized protein (DUF983 family)
VAGISYGQAVGRAAALKCPRCGRGDLFRRWLAMHTRCPDCGLLYERAPGFFLGSTYLNYGFVSVTLIAMYMGLHFGLGLSNAVLTAPLVAYCVVVPLILFRYARAWWTATSTRRAWKRTTRCRRKRRDRSPGIAIPGSAKFARSAILRTGCCLSARCGDTLCIFPSALEFRFRDASPAESVP